MLVLLHRFILFALALMGSAAVAKEPTVGVKFRTELQNTQEKVDDQTNEHTAIVVPYVRVFIKGASGPWDYQFRMRLNKTATNEKRISGLNKNADYAYLGYQVTEDLKVTFGRQFSLAGAWEYYDGSFREVLFSEVYQQIPVGYDTGVGFGYQWGEQWLGLQVINGPSYTEEQENGDLSLLGSFYGSFGPIKSILSLGSYPRHRESLTLGDETKKDDAAPTSHWAFGLRAEQGGWTIDVETAQLKTPKNTSFSIDEESNAFVETERAKEVWQSHILKLTYAPSRLRYFLKVVQDTYEKPADTPSIAEEGTKNSIALGAFYRPSEENAEIHVAVVQSELKIKGEADDSSKSKFILGYSVKI